MASGLGRVAGVVASLITFLATLVAIIFAMHIVFVVFGANPDNAVVVFVRDLAERLAFVFRDLFLPQDERVRVLVNYGLAAVVYLVVGRFVAGLVRRTR
ncbi:MAG: hypothetical protein GEV03_23770 [Streptosporangiales bacterium]|nr:hypothetical protein [Streptosporangiales bacterium]